MSAEWTLQTPDTGGTCCGCRTGCEACAATCTGYTGNLDIVVSGFGSAGCKDATAGPAAKAEASGAGMLNGSFTLTPSGGGTWADEVDSDAPSAQLWCGSACSGTAHNSATNEAEWGAVCVSDTEITMSLVVYWYMAGDVSPCRAESNLISEDVYHVTIAFPTTGSPSSGTFTLASGFGLLTPGSVTVSLP